MWRGTLKCLFAYFGFFLCHSGGMFVLCCCCCCCMKDNASNLTWQLINSPFSITCANYPRTRWMNPSSLTLVLFMYLHVQVKWQIIYYSFQYLRFVDKFFSRMKRSFSYLMNQYFGGNLNLNSSGVLLSLFCIDYVEIVLVVVVIQFLSFALLRISFSSLFSFVKDVP